MACISAYHTLTITQPPHPQFIIFLGETYEVNHHYFAIDGQLNNHQAP